tara:strand:- start:982 stop:1440 length:459 start_codon:yes stop_codon:yes gene_type:complete
MIDPISAFGMLTSAHAGIKKIISMGKDLSSATNYIKKYANAEAELNFGKERKKKGFLGFGGVTSDALDLHFKKEEQKKMHEELRSMFLLYGSTGEWERLQATIAQVRAERKKQLEEQAKKRDFIIKCVVGISVATVGGVAIYFWALYLKGSL